jgi:hypothetical protein
MPNWMWLVCQSLTRRYTRRAISQPLIHEVGGAQASVASVSGLKRRQTVFSIDFLC